MQRSLLVFLALSALLFSTLLHRFEHHSHARPQNPAHQHGLPAEDCATCTELDALAASVLLLFGAILIFATPEATTLLARPVNFSPPLASAPGSRQARAPPFSR